MTINCEAAQTNLAWGKELDKDTAAHVALCTTCQTVQAEMTKFDRLVHASLQSDVSPGFVDNLMQQIPVPRDSRVAQLILAHLGAVGGLALMFEFVFAILFAIPG